MKQLSSTPFFVFDSETNNTIVNKINIFKHCWQNGQKYGKCEQNQLKSVKCSQNFKPEKKVILYSTLEGLFNDITQLYDKNFDRPKIEQKNQLSI